MSVPKNPGVAAVLSVGESAAGTIGLLILASPKSRILTWPRGLMKMLAGLMSR